MRSVLCCAKITCLGCPLTQVLSGYEDVEHHVWVLKAMPIKRVMLWLHSLCSLVNVHAIRCMHAHFNPMPFSMLLSRFKQLPLMVLWAHVKEINEGYISIPWDLLTKCHWGYHKSCHLAYQMLVISFRREMKVPQSGHLHPPAKVSVSFSTLFGVWSLAWPQYVVANQGLDDGGTWVRPPPHKLGFGPSS